MIRFSIHISGKVQKVFFRHNAKKIAEILELTGWIKNTADGGIACEVQGEEIIVDQFISFILRGPRFAEVKKVTIEYIDPIPEEEGFELITG